MIHYNPTEHHDELMKHIASAVLSCTELDTPQMPMLNNGTQCWALRTEENTYLFTDMELWTQLVKDAFNSLEGWNNGKSFCKPMTEEEYDMMRKVVIHPKDHTISVLK